MRQIILSGFLIASWLLVWPVQGWSKPSLMRLYLNADFTHSSEASSAIKNGIKVALDEIGNQVHGIPLELSFLDHRGNTSRSKLNNKKILQDPDALAVFTGIHSTVIIPNRTFINESQILTLVPWAAGGPITRYPASENWIFRLSVDDSRTGAFLVNYAMETRQCRQPHLLLENSPWGDSNLGSMTKSLRETYNLEPSVSRFSYNQSEASARIMLRQLSRKKADCLLLVVNDKEARSILNAMNSLPAEQQLPVISHWGVSTGTFWSEIPTSPSSDDEMRFVQTCYSFNSDPHPSEFRQSVFERLTSLDPTIQEPKDLRPQVGFIHAYDLTRVLISALEQIEISDDMKANSDAVRLALENLKEPVEGLLKVYEKPFSVFDAKNQPNAHEALGPDEFCMAYFDKDGVIYLEQR